ncbi:prepilin-type N-terminal cleavage/methylation domain containing protein [Synechococcus sp. BIOS-E4-1]|uniref:pilus assembly FimT family protein n=1 Tax=Synechococcus sp. BIOS-E4-1 TaxID=1400864 RepID=UPI00164718C3|nr:GspH/FimT family pseudopilin [Synechococcus sp. BIOS-E4-1]QNI53318.1 prepilin-type N-terminal cleavage/methylation domain containing protein [Synechococcus sp. BIOS-E4-1]
MKRVNAGFSLVELVVTVALLGIIASLVVPDAASDRDRLQLDAAARRLQLGLERARLAARRAQQACGISLGSDAWLEPGQQQLPAALAPCSGVDLALQEAFEQGPIRVHTNLPELIRVSANGLLLDGGTTVLSHERLDQGRCLVVSLPLGVSRVGTYQGDLPALGEAPRSTLCKPRVQEG